MNKEYDGHRRVFGKGVTNTLIKKVNGDGSASTVPREIVKSPTVSLEVEKGQSSDKLRDLEANYERRISQLKEDHARQLEAMQPKNDDDRERLIEDAVRNILGKLPPDVVRGELRIKSAILAPAHEQASSKSSRKKRKHMELEPEIRIPGLECNRALPKNVPFVNNMVIEEPEYGIFFTDEFSDQAFQRWSDIDKVGMKALVSYLVAASMGQSPENARFNMKLKNLIAEHHDQEKLKSKKVKLEALGYEMN
ncbi:hypothetical protein Tco_1173345 [Tanacetum coccineum]